ncbi:iron-sulfur cluster assembly scaffold protein [Sphingomonas changnyeongensis]|uniref:Iron-sulfur cluster assembly scaffold protein n=1 Tax=Sphingomonas changnyeongensis TaxID=2698679 RepID=A0A7Z2S982_9SPHN|nr:iron-sulfur cluster assembly scaffold protein [Sphingomonas changnyeongensis]QHL91482.1 iron-sulfur cluster assembly scaffold protein [Sphingomonas changnyeongensis]
MTAPLYTTEILRLAASIPHLGRLAAPMATVARRAVPCGSAIALDLDLDADGRVAALGIDLSACALGQASACLMARAAIGRTPGELAAARDALAAWLAGTADEPGDWPDLMLLARARPHAGRHGAIRLPFEAAAAAADAALTERQR